LKSNHTAPAPARITAIGRPSISMTPPACVWCSASAVNSAARRAPVSGAPAAR